MYPQCLNNLKNEFLTSQGERIISIYVCRQFCRYSPTFTRTQCFRLLFARILKTAVLSAPVKNEKTFNQHISDAC